MKLRYSDFYISLALLIGLFGCKKLVDIDPPVNKLVTSNVFENDNTTIAAQLGVYSKMQSNAVAWNLAAITGLSSDELVYYAPGQVGKDLYANNLSSTNDASSLPWSAAYSIIYQENAIIQNVQASTGITLTTMNLTLGEAEFTRAYWYFYLVNLYGDVPLILTTDYSTNTNIPRTASATVYKQIIADLKDASTKLSANYLDATDTAQTSDRVRPTTWAASALLARVYLYEGNYDSATIATSAVINNSSLFSLPSLSAVFLKNSSEAIWQLMPPSTQSYVDGQYFILTTPPTLGGSALSNSCGISNQLLNTFETGDQRKTTWISSYKNGTSTWYFPYKYQDNSVKLNNSGEYTMVLRLAEQYLIRAEAEVHANDLTDAINDLNVIRKRAGLAALSNSLNQAQVLSAVMHERQVELFTEAHRWLDLKRTNAVDSTMSAVDIQKGSIWSSYQQLYPLQVSDVQTSTNLQQNPGYQ